MSTTLRRMILKLLKGAGFHYLKTQSNFKIKYLISLGDYSSENPFFNPAINTEEIISCVAWCIDIDEPVIFDVGAHCGYFSTHFAVLLNQKNPRIFAFEPTTQTYFDLLSTVNKLQLRKNIFPIQAALSAAEDFVTLNYSRERSMLSQITTGHENKISVIEEKNFAVATTINKISRALKIIPHLIKLDVEGYESFVLQGANDILKIPERPAICIEWNPETLRQCGSSVHELASLLKGYDLFYLDDYESGRIEFLKQIDSPETISWVCNLFAVPAGSGRIKKWKENINKIREARNVSIPQHQLS